MSLNTIRVPSPKNPPRHAELPATPGEGKSGAKGRISSAEVAGATFEGAELAFRR